MAYPARGSKLDPYAEEIFALHREGRPLAYIGKHLAATYGLGAALSTLSEFIKRGPRTAAAPVPPPSPAPLAGTQPTVSEEMLLDQVEVYAEIQGAIRLLGEDVQAIRAGLPALGTDIRTELAGFTTRLEAFGGQIATLTRAGSALLPAAIPALSNRPEAPLRAREQQAAAAELPVPPAVLRRIWARAFGAASVLWLVLFAVFVYVVGFR